MVWKKRRQPDVPSLYRLRDCLAASQVPVERVVGYHVGEEDVVEEGPGFGVEGLAVAGEGVLDGEVVVGERGGGRHGGWREGGEGFGVWGRSGVIWEGCGEDRGRGEGGENGKCLGMCIGGVGCGMYEGMSGSDRDPAVGAVGVGVWEW